MSIPALRFKGDDGRNFPEWKETTLGEIGKFKSGTGFSDIEQGGTSGIPFYKVSDMNLAENKSEMLVANNYVSEEQIKKLKYKVICDDAIVFAKVGAAIFLERKRKAKNFLIDNNMMAFIPSCQINFIKHFMDSIRLSKFAQVGALPSYNASDLSIIEIAVPCVNEQTKIANFLSAVDEKIHQLTQKHDLLIQYKKGLMQKIFSQELRFKDNDGQEFPEWGEKLLGELFNITSSKRVFQNEWTKSGVPFYRAREVVKLSENGFVDSELFISTEMYNEYKTKYGVPKENDLLVTGVGTIGILYVVKADERFYFKDGNIIWLKTLNKVNSQFVSQLFKSPIIKKQIDDNASITTVGTYTIDSAKKTVIPFPCLKEQIKIAKFLAAIDDKITQTQAELGAVKQYKQGLLQQMFV